MVNRATLADKLSTIPGLSTPIGIGQAVVAFGKTIVVEPAKALTREAKIAYYNFQFKSDEKFLDSLPMDNQVDLDTLNFTKKHMDGIDEKRQALIAQRTFTKNEKQNVKELGTGLLRAIPFVGNAHAIATCINSDEPVRKATAADKASTFLGANVVVGLGTVGSNLFKCAISDPIKAIGRHFKIYQLNKEIKNIQKELQAANPAPMRDWDLANDKIAELEEQIAEIRKQGDFKEHAKHIGIGLLRASPVGPIYSGIVWARSNKADAKVAKAAAELKRAEDHVLEMKKKDFQNIAKEAAEVVNFKEKHSRVIKTKINAHTKNLETDRKQAAKQEELTELKNKVSSLRKDKMKLKGDLLKLHGQERRRVNKAIKSLDKKIKALDAQIASFNAV